MSLDRSSDLFASVEHVFKSALATKEPPLLIQGRLRYQYEALIFSCCGGRIRTYDLWVMSPTSYHCSTPRYLFALQR